MHVNVELLQIPTIEKPRKPFESLCPNLDVTCSGLALFVLALYKNHNRPATNTTRSWMTFASSAFRRLSTTAINLIAPERQMNDGEMAAAPSTPPNTAGLEQPDIPSHNFVSVFEGGNVVLFINGVAGFSEPVGIRCSSHILTMTSPVFKTLLTGARDGEIHLHMVDDDGDALLILCNLLHLRNDALPSRLPADPLYRVAVLADKYQCSTAVGRATMGWFDRLYRQPIASTSTEINKILQAAYLLDEPMAFVRFSERWVMCEPIGTVMPPAHISPQTELGKRLATGLQNRRIALIAAVRVDFDLIIDPCSSSFSDSTSHYIDYMPGMSPEPDEETGSSGSHCYVDSHCAALYLGTLRDKNVWPATVWPRTLDQIVQNLRTFKPPPYDDCDKCEFCEDTKGKFGLAIELIRQIHRGRLWGLCLDCFKAAGEFAPGECRYEHPRPPPSHQSVLMP
nr:hypothetical protein CFP56_10476 [Quercus suber]